MGIEGCFNKQAIASSTSSKILKTSPTQIKFMPEKVGFILDYQSSMKNYATIDRYDTKEIRRMYTSEDLLNRANYKELPIGTKIIMVHEKPKMVGNEFARDENDRFISTGEIIKISIMQKEKGWGTQYPDRRHSNR